MDILRALWKVGCNDIKVFLRLFDAQVQPALLYAAEIWGVHEVKAIEQIHMYACKKVLSVSQKTPNMMIYSELGRLPLHINATVRAVSYWLKLTELRETRLPKSAYETLLSMDKKGISTWATAIKDILFRNGFSFVWVAQGVQNKTGFIREFKQRLVDGFSQDWHDKIYSSARFLQYSHFKHVLEFEAFLSTLTAKRYRDAIVRFRLGVNALAANKYRYSQNDQARICPLCKTAEEDEMHFVFFCPALQQIRNTYIQPYTHSDHPSLTDIKEILRTNCFDLAKFIVESEQIRNNLPTE